MSDFVQIVTTTPTVELARQIAAHLVERRLVACAQIVGPIESVYRWEGRIETATEWQCAAKTRQACIAEVELAIRALHTYRVPEILVTPIATGSADYLDFLAAETTPAAADGTAGHAAHMGEKSAPQNSPLGRSPGAGQNG